MEGPSLPTVGVRVETDRVKQKFIDQAGRLAKATGKDIVFTSDDDAGKNGWYKDQTIYVNTRSGNALGQIVSHELTHSTEFAEAYKDLAQAVFARIEKLGADLKALRKQKMDLYAKHGITLTSQEEVDQEIVAEFVERYLLTDAETILDVVSGNRTLGERIRNWFDRLLAKLGGEKAEERVFLENARNLWAKALEQSRVQLSEYAEDEDSEFAPWNPKSQDGTEEFDEPEFAPWQPAQQPKADDGGRDETLEWACQMFDSGEWTEEEYDAFLDEYALPEEELGTGKFSISRTEDNKPFVITDRDILSGVNRNNWISTVKENLKNKFPNGVTVGRNQIRIDKRSREELTYSGYMRWLKNNDPQAYQDKLRATDNADEILLAATDWINETPAHSRRDRITDFGRGTILLRVGGNDYRAKVVVGTESDGKMRLYDILDMQRTQITEKETDAAIAANPSPGAGRNTASVSANSVAQPQNSVNPQFSISDHEENATVGELQVELYELKRQRDSVLAENPDYRSAQEMRRNATTMKDRVAATKALRAAEAGAGVSEIDRRMAAVRERIEELNNRERMQHRQDQEKYSGTKTAGYSQKPDTRLRTLDLDYMKAVKAGDRKLMQRLVDEAAEAAMPDSVVRDGNGKLLKVYHHTGSENTVFVEGTGEWSYATDDPETTSIKEQLAQHQESLNNMDPVANVTVPTNLKDRRTAYNWALELLKPTGYRVERQGFGRIWFEKDDINYGLNYADTPEEKAALALLPRILKRGIEVGRHGNHKLRQKETVTFAAPAIVNGTRVNMAAVVTVRNGRYYTHRIMLPDGRIFKFGAQKNSDATREPLRGVPNSGSLAEATSVASKNSLSNPEPDVKRFSISDVSESETERAEEQAQAKTAQQIREEMPAKARSHLQGAERKLLKTLGDVLAVSKFQNREELQKIVREIADTFLTEGRVSDDQMDFLFDRAYAGGIVEDATFYNQYKEIKDHLRTTGVTLSRQDQSDIPDFRNFRKHASGTVKIVNQGGLPVDSAYHELTGMAPNLFPESITHPADQLVRMYEVARSIQVSEVSLQHHWGQMAEEYRGWARHDFGEKVGDVIRDLRSVKAVAEEAEAKRNAKSDVPQTAEEAKEVYKELKQARKTYEKVRAKTLLTERDEQQVGRLLRGEILTGDLNPEENNIRAVTAVYEAKKEYERISKLIAEYKKHVRAQRQEKADRFLQNAMNWKDKAVGIAYSRETMERNIYDIVPDRAEAEAVIREYFSPVHEAEANATRFKNQLRDRIRKLNLSRKVQKGNFVSEAHAVQLLGEAEDNIRVLKASRGRMKQRDGKSLQEWETVIDQMWKESPGLDQGKIRAAVAEFRGIYDMLFEQMNEVRVRNGYEPVNYRQGYFPHFQPGDGDGVLAHFGKVLGIDTQVAALPTSINGLTHTFKPGIQWFGNAQERLGFNTAYDAVEGFDKYLEGVASVIFQTDNIQNLRALESRIRYRTTDDGIRQEVDAVNADDRLTEEEKKIKISDIYEHGRYTLSNFVTELTEYTNLLANKKSRLDRTMEGLMGRRAYTIMKAWENRVGANMIAGNISSALTNFIPMTQAGAQLGSGSMLEGMWQTLKGMKADDGIPGMSTFLTNRRGSDPLVKTWTQTASEKLKMNVLMDLVDGFTSESIFRAAYIRNLNAGLSESEALYQADIFASSVMADRSKGAMPTLFESTNPIFKMFTQFQLEVNNQYSEIFKDLPRRFREKGVLALTLVYFKYFLGAFLFNELYEFFAGRRSALDPIGILNDTVGDLTGYELPNMVEWITGGDVSFQTEKKGLADTGINLAKTALGELPFSSGLTMLGIETDGGRIPASSAVPDLTALWRAATEEGWSKEKRWKEVSDELWKLSYIIPPFGGNQVQKIWKGTKAWIEGGSYSVDKDGNDILQYPVYKQTTEEKFWNLVRAAFLGKSSLPEAQDWVESGFDSLGAKQTAVYQDLIEMGAGERETFELLRGLEGLSELKGLEKKQAEAELLSSAGMTDEEKKAIVGYLLGTELLTEAGNPTQYAKFLIATDRGLSVDDYMDLRGAGIDIEKFLEATDAGSTAEDAVTLVKAMADLEPESGADDVSDLQKWRLCIDSFGSEAGQMSALCGYMTPAQFEKVQRAYNMGVKPDTYISMRELLPRFDADGNGSLTNKEVQNAIDTMRISNDQKAVLWQLATGSTSAKNNPYSTKIGQEVLDAKG